MADNPAKTCNTCGRQFRTEADFLKNTSRWRLCERGNLWFNCDCHSTNMIIKGKFDWYSPELFMSSSAKSVFNTLPALKELPHLPTAVMELQQLVSKENITANQLATATKKDPLLASYILNIANNLKIEDDGSAIDSLEHAISYIGLRGLSDIILTASVRSFPFRTKFFQADPFWESCFLAGSIAEKLGQRFAPKIPKDELYLAAALANLGKVVLAICCPEEADDIAMRCQNPKSLSSWLNNEQKLKTHDHCVLGEIAASFWGLPEYVMICASQHHAINSSKVAAIDPELLNLVKFANQLVHWIELEPYKIDEPILSECAKHFRLDERAIEETADGLMSLKSAS